MLALFTAQQVFEIKIIHTVNLERIHRYVPPCIVSYLRARYYKVTVYHTKIKTRLKNSPECLTVPAILPIIKVGKMMQMLNVACEKARCSSTGSFLFHY